ncbi:hypothetical protein [Hyphomicrobium sp. ghe19]|uniref:hypothetical protein n=1 Tax=Hyphomicrobium sp. ghe19 TaxID=2682968 RepID=UPI001367937F|nr:hypothetical protein HYPP_02635 [Hyphomicrobium sp. ghe19]
MDTALIAGGVVTQVWRDTAKDTLEGVEGTLVEFAPNEVVCGMLWNGSQLSVPTPVTAVPTVVSPYQARIVLLQAGLMDEVEAMMASPDIEPAAKIAWEYATGFYRDSPFINTLGSSLGLTSSQIDDLFIAASQVP